MDVQGHSTAGAGAHTGEATAEINGVSVKPQGHEPRTGVADLRGLAATLIQADKFGSSVAQALRTQSDSMRLRRSQLAEEKAAKTAVKLIFPLVIFIFPAIFIVLVGPAAITMVNEMFPAMNGGK